MKNKIYIVSEPIQSGKTTMIWQWINNFTEKSVGGILTPDIDGFRKLLDLETGKVYNLQLPSYQNGLAIGRFVFDNVVFKTARQIILTAKSGKFKWFVIDEIGRLEIDQKNGLEPAISEVIKYFKETPSPTRLILVIRDYLLNDALKHYGITHFDILDKAFFKNTIKC
ncbi:MAG: nucleoside-triphosphatase [Bacteroidia bacterium]